MNGLTLKTLRKAIHVIKTSKRFQHLLGDETWNPLIELQHARKYMTGAVAVEPRDPRLVLKEIGYRL